MKVLACVALGFQTIVYGKLREEGHDVIELDVETLMADVADIIEQVKPDVFFWDPGAPTKERCSMVHAVMGFLGQPAAVFFNALPNDWATYCSEELPKVQVIGLRERNFTEALTAAVTAKAA